MINPETAHKLFQPLQIIYTEFIRGESEHQKTWRRGGHSTRVFQRQIAGAHQCRSLKQRTNRDLLSRFAYSLKTGRRFYYYLLLFFIYPIMAFNFCCQWCPYVVLIAL